MPEVELDRQFLALFGRMKVEDPEVREWFDAVLASQTRDAQADTRAQRHELQREASLLVAQQDRLVNMRLGEEVDQDTFTHKHTELRIGWLQSRCSSTFWTVPTTKPGNWRSKRLNSHKPCKTHGFRRMTPPSGASSKSCA